MRGTIIGKAILCDVRFYENRNLFLKDRNRYLAGTEYSDHKHGFLVKNSRRFKKPIVIPGKLGFFSMELD